MYRNPATGLINVGQILTVLERTGVRRGKIGDISRVVSQRQL